jgi:hypothetical protein
VCTVYTGSPVVHDLVDDAYDSEGVRRSANDLHASALAVNHALLPVTYSDISQNRRYPKIILVT